MVGMVVFLFLGTYVMELRMALIVVPDDEGVKLNFYLSLRKEIKIT